MKRKNITRFCRKISCFLFSRSPIFPIFLVSFILLLFPQSIHADKGPFYFLEYAGLLFLRFLPLVGLAALIKIYLLKRRFALGWKMIRMISIKTISEIYAEVVYFLLLFYFLSPILSAKILSKIGFVSSLGKSPEALELLFTIIILLPLQCLLGAILNLVLVYSYFSEKMKKSFKEFSYGLLLSLIFPFILLVFVAAGILSKHYTPLL